MRTAIEIDNALDKDRWAAHKSVMELMYVLRDFIPHACQREAEDRLYDLFLLNGVELTSNIMRKEYEQWKKLELNGMMTSRSVIINETSTP